MNFERLVVWLSVLVVAAVTTGAWAAADVGLVNHLSGDVSYQGASAIAKAAPFMKVRDGDRFTVPEGAMVRVIYFDSGRQETWKGPASFRAGQKQADAVTGRAEVSQLPGGAPARLAQTAEVIQIAKLGRAGGVTVRGIRSQQLNSAQSAEVAQAKKTYESWRASAAPDDITPELYLYTVLDSYLLYDDMKAAVKAMQDRQPNSQEVRDLAAWVNHR